MKFKNIRNNAHTRLVKETINNHHHSTVEERMLHKLGHETDVAVVLNFKNEIVGTVNLNSDPFVQDLKGFKED